MLYGGWGNTKFIAMIPTLCLTARVFFSEGKEENHKTRQRRKITKAVQGAAAYGTLPVLR
jgi:hypothetical protein